MIFRKATISDLDVISHLYVTENMDGEYGIPDLFVPLRCDHNN